MNKVYSRIIWKNYPNTSTAINETNLNRMDKAIDDLDNRVIEQDSTKANQTTVNNMVKNWTMDETTGVITVEKQDGSKIMFDLNIEKIPVDFELSPSGMLTMTTSDGTQFTANIGSMIPVLTFNESDQIAVSVSGSGVNKTYSFSIKDNSITEDKLQPNFLADIKVQSANASLSANNAETSATQAQSYAIGGTGTRENEDTDNAMYYYEQAKKTDIGQISSKVDEINSKLSEQLGSHTVKSDVPENAVFTDTVYDDTEVQKRISDNGYGEVAGGKNVLNPTLQTTTQNGVACTNNGDGTYTFTGTASQDTGFTLFDYKGAILDFKRLRLVGFPFKYNIEKLGLAITNTTWDKVYSDDGEGVTFDCSNYKASIVYVNFPQGYKCNDLLIKPMLTTDLTATYDDYEPYFPSNKMLAEETSQQSTEMMDIKMLGWSVPRECPIQNEVNGNQFVQKVGRADLGSLNWEFLSPIRFVSSAIEDSKSPIGNDSLTKVFLKGYTTTSVNSLIANEGKFVGLSTSLFVSIKDSSYTDLTTFKSAMQGQYLYYELANYNTMTIDGNELGETVSDVRKETTVNLLNPTLQTTTLNGVTCTNNGDGTYTLSGTASDNFSEYITKLFNLSKDKTYKLIGTPANGSIETYSITLLSEDFSDYVDDVGNGVTITPKKSSYLARLNITKGTTVDNLVFKPMLTTNLDTTYDDFISYTGSNGSLNENVAEIRKDIQTLENYTSTETVIGKWDDYTLCRKVISGKHAITAGNEFSFLVDTITSDEGVVMEIKNIRGRAQGSILSVGNKDVDGVMAVGSYCNANYYCGCFMPGSSPESVSLLGKFGNSVNYVEVELCVEYTVERI